VMRCDYCGTVVDVPDTSTVAESTTTRAIGPGGLTVTTTRKKVMSRSDGVGDAGGRGEEKVVEIDMGDKKAALRQLHELIREHIPNGAEIDLADLEAFVNDAFEPGAAIPGDRAGRVLEIARDGGSLRLDLAGLLGLSGGFSSAERGLDRREITLTATSRTSRRSGQISRASAGGSTSSAARRGPHSPGVRVPLWLIVTAATLALIIAIVVLA
jgi:hypothetical protein